MQDEVLQQAFMNLPFHLEDAHTHAHVQRLCVSWTTLRHEQQDDTIYRAIFILLGRNLKMDTYLYAQPQWFDTKNVAPAKVSYKYLQKSGENPELGIIGANRVSARLQLHKYVFMWITQKYIRLMDIIKHDRFNSFRSVRFRKLWNH